MMTEIVTKRFVACPTCKQYEHSVEHLFTNADRTFGPWQCRTDDCRTEIWGTAHADGSISIRTTEAKPRGFALCKLRDLYLVLKEPYGRVENPDYFYHSHQCPTNLMRNVIEVIGPSGERDTHGMIRYVASIDDTPETREKLSGDKSALSRRQLFELFATDGEPIATDWPEADEGVIPMIAEWQREEEKNS